MIKFIYADNAATTKLDLGAFEAMKPYLTEEYGNAFQSYSFARNPKMALKKSREIIAQCINASPEEIFFTSGGTESDNWAIVGSAFANKNKNQIITSCIEHHAILNSCKAIENLGYPVQYTSVNNEGLICEQDLIKYLSKNTYLVSFMAANNEIGSIQPIESLCKIAHLNGALFHTDAVQAVGHINIDVKKLGIDMLSASAHKFNGPKGIGFFYIKKGTPICRYLSGGYQEFGMRAGTENVASIVGMATALKNNCDNLNKNIDYINDLENLFLQLLSQSGIEYIINGSHNHLPGLLSISFPNQDGEALLHRLDLMGISISTGAACDNINTQISHVIEAIKLEKKYAIGTIRISIGKYNNINEIVKIVNALKKILKNDCQIK